MEIVLGIDAGGTRTRVALATVAGRVLGTGEAGPGNPRAVGIAGLRAELTRALAAAWSAAQETPRPVDALCAGVAGVWTDAERAEVRTLLRSLELAPEAATGVTNDLATAHSGAFAGGEGIAVVAGTGAVAYGRNAAGDVARAGGWGSWLDDRGGGCDLGRRALSACLRALDGRGPDTALVPAIRERLGLASWRELARHDPLPRADVAALAPLVLTAAGAGDVAAESILAAGANELASAARAVADRLQLEAPRIARIGGLTRSQIWRRATDAALSRSMPAARIVDARSTPLAGAVELAFAQLGWRLDEDALARLRRELSRAAPAS